MTCSGPDLEPFCIILLTTLEHLTHPDNSEVSTTVPPSGVQRFVLQHAPSIKECWIHLFRTTYPSKVH